MKNKFVCLILGCAFLCGTAFASGAASEDVKSTIAELKKQTKMLEEQIGVLQKRIENIQPSVSKSPSKMKRDGGGDKKDLTTLVELYAHGPAVVTSPSFGVRRASEDSVENDSPLMAQLSPVNEDLVLLHLRKKMDDYAVKHDIDIPTRPIIALSGALEGQVKYNSGYPKTDNIDINLSAAELDIIGETGPWVTSALIMAYDDARLSSGTRVSNSRFKLDRGFVTIGQLNKFPVYFTIGQLFAPFGRYSSDMITFPPTKVLGSLKDRMVVLGYSKGAFDTQIYSFAGETKGINNGTGRSILGHSGFSVGYGYNFGGLRLDVEGGVVGNMAETEEMQKDVFTTNESIHSRVWGANGRVKLSYDKFSLLSEYVGAGKKFDSRDLAFNSDGARPQALNVEGTVEFKVFNKPSSFTLGYGQTWQALALQIPKNMFFTVYDIEFFKNTLFAIEYRHDINYNWNDASTWNNGASSRSVVGGDKGRHKNTVTAKFAVFF